MSLEQFEYRFRATAPRYQALSTGTGSAPAGTVSVAVEKTPNRKSLAKKKWWADKRAREKAEWERKP